MGLTTGSVVHAQDFRDISSTQEVVLGRRAETVDGRIFRYSLAGGTTLDPGKMNEQSAIVANHANVAVAAAVAVGSTTVTATLGATAATLNQYAGGYLNVNDATGEGISYLIKGHAAVASSGVITVELAEPVKVALTTSSEVTLKTNLYSGVIVVPSAATPGGVPTGVANVSITNAYYGWLQTAGPVSALCGATVFTLGEEASQGASLTAGSFSLKVATHPTYGHAMQLGVSTEYQLVDLTLN